MTAAQRRNARMERIFSENLPRAFPYITGDGQRFRTEAEAIAHANHLAEATDIVVSVEHRP